MTARRNTTAEPVNEAPAEQAPADEGFPRTVRASFQPGRDISVTATEYAELKAQGVLIENKGK